MKEVFNSLQQAKSQYKQQCLKRNILWLNENDIDYETFNSGYHLKINFFNVAIIDFYPSTNKWIFEKRTFLGDAEALLKWVNRNLKGI